jgi:hypothetical protein
MRPATSPESAADPIARAVANRAGAVLDPHDRATLEHAARDGLADAVARAHAGRRRAADGRSAPDGLAFDGQARSRWSRRSRYFWLSFASEISRQVFPRTICVQEGPAIGRRPGRWRRFHSLARGVSRPRGLSAFVFVNGGPSAAPAHCIAGPSGARINRGESWRDLSPAETGFLLACNT